MAEKSKSSGKPITDVAHPNKSAPAQNSKSVIVTSRPMLKDPMVVDEESKPKLEAKEETSKNTITEIAAIAAADKAPKDEKPAEDKPITDTKEPEDTKPEPAEEPKIETPKSEEPKSDDKKSVIEDKDTLPENQLAIEDSKTAEREAIVQKLSESKKYFLPINAVEKRRSKQFVILGVVLSIVLALAWVDIALDASIITIPGVKPITNLF